MYNFRAKIVIICILNIYKNYEIKTVRFRTVSVRNRTVFESLIYGKKCFF